MSAHRRTLWGPNVGGGQPWERGNVLFHPSRPGGRVRVLQILLAEDNHGDVLLVRESLQEHQIEHELHVVHDGQEALDYLVRIGKLDEVPCPDLMLLDLNLLKGDGHPVLTEFRKHPECASMPVVVVTSSDFPKDRERMAKLKINYYFRKPTEYDAFMQLGGIVREVLEKEESKH